MQFYLGTTRLQLEHKGDQNHHFTAFANIIPAFGFLGIPFMTWLLDKKGYGVTLTTINFLTVLASLFEAMPSLRFQVNPLSPSSTSLTLRHHAGVNMKAKSSQGCRPSTSSPPLNPTCPLSAHSAGKDSNIGSHFGIVPPGDLSPLHRPPLPFPAMLASTLSH